MDTYRFLDGKHFMDAYRFTLALPSVSAKRIGFGEANTLRGSQSKAKPSAKATASKKRHFVDADEEAPLHGRGCGRAKHIAVHETVGKPIFLSILIGPEHL